VDDDPGFGTRVRNSCLPEVEAARTEWADEPQPMSDFQCLAWEISAVWALPTIGTAIWAYHEPAALLDFGIFAAFQIWFVGRAVTGL
jgi:hypothetical protein